VRFLGAHRKYAHRIHSFCKRQGFAKLSALAQKRGFACALKYLISQKYFKRDKVFLVRDKKTPTYAEKSVFRLFFKFSRLVKKGTQG